ncbi:MAG: glycosyltransferase [Planctomycetes bacterium]|nr:glycosyltransferase [Planctomycetota bacterium]
MSSPARILVVRHGLPASDCAAAFRSLGCEVGTVGEEPSVVEAAAKGFGADAVFSVNVHAAYARACGRLGCRYLAWILDPLVNWRKVPDDLDALGPHCQVGSYDPVQVDLYRRSAAREVFLLPAGANASRFCPGNPPGKRYPVSFVGTSLLRETNEFAVIRSQLRARVASGQDATGYSATTLSLCDAVVERQLADVSSFRMKSLLEEEERRLGLTVIAPEWTPEKRTFLMGLAKEAASRERIEAVRALQGIAVTVHGTEDWRDVLSGTLVYGGRIDSERELPNVYRRTDVNLNLTRFYAGDVVPPRVFEVLAAGGFVLTNDTPAIEGLLVPGEEVETFRTREELREKVEAALADPARARAVAVCGRQRVLADHTVERRLLAFL